MFLGIRKPRMVSAAEALPGRAQAMAVPERHEVLGTPLTEPFPEGSRKAMFAMGCFWGAEQLFWEQPGVYTTAVGYAGGYTPNPTYEEVCSGRTGHAEAVLIVYFPRELSYERLLPLFWEGHDPTQGMRQGNDIGTQYRSGIYVYDAEQKAAAEASGYAYQRELDAAGYSAVTTEIVDATRFYYAEPYHQQYLVKNPGGYCGLGGTGIACPLPGVVPPF